MTGLEVDLRQAGPVPLAAAFGCLPGELMALVGPSGSGKTTLLRCIAGLHRPRGTIVCHGETWLDSGRGIALPPQRRRVGMVFQDFALFPHLTVLENVALGVRTPSRTERAREWLARVHLPGLEGRMPATLSGGQKQRVALARALAGDPAVVLLDEPFSAVDQVTRHRLRLEMAELRRGLDLPVVLVTHDLEEAEMLADRMAVIHHGRILQQGPPQEVMQRPASAEVARLVDIRNLFEGEVTGAGPGHTGYLRWPGGRLEVDWPDRLRSGERVDWCIPPAGVVLHSRLRPSRGADENPVRGRIVEIVHGGGRVQVLMAPAGAAHLRLHLDLPQHVAARNRLAVGEEIGVSLLRKYVHLMPRQ